MKNNFYSRSGSIFSYWYNRIKNIGAVTLILRAAKYIKRYLLITRLIKIAAVILAIIETSAVLILAATGVILMLPFLLAAFIITAISGKRGYGKYNPLIKAAIDKAEKIVFIEAKKGFFRKRHSYLRIMCQCFQNEGYTVFVVSGSLGYDRFLSARRIDEKIWVIKLNYYYHIKKKYLKNKDQKLTYIY